MICSHTNVDLKSEAKDKTWNPKQYATQTSLEASPSPAHSNPWSPSTYNLPPPRKFHNPSKDQSMVPFSHTIPDSESKTKKQNRNSKTRSHLSPLRILPSYRHNKSPRIIPHPIKIKSNTNFPAAHTVNFTLTKKHRDKKIRTISTSMANLSRFPILSTVISAQRTPQILDALYLRAAISWKGGTLPKF